MSFLEGFAQGFTQERNRRLEKEQRNEELKLQYAMPELMKRKGEWEAQKEKDKSYSQQATTLAQQVGDPSFVSAAMQELKNGVPYQTMQERIAKGHYAKTKKDTTVVVPTDPTAPVSTPSAVANPMPKADSTPMTTDGVVTPLPTAPKTPVAVPEAVKAKGPVGPTGDVSEGPADSTDTETRRVDGKLFEGINKVSPDMAQFYKDSPDTLRTEDTPVADSGWTLKADAVEGKLSPMVAETLKDGPEAAKRLVEADKNGSIILNDVDRAAINRVLYGGVTDPAKAEIVIYPKTELEATSIMNDPGATERQKAVAQATYDAIKSQPKITADMDPDKVKAYKAVPSVWNKLSLEEKQMGDGIILNDEKKNSIKEEPLTEVEAYRLSKFGKTEEEKRRGQESYDSWMAVKKLGENDWKDVDYGISYADALKITKLPESVQDTIPRGKFKFIEAAIAQGSEAETKKQAEETAKNQATSGDTFFIKEGNDWKVVPAGTPGAKKWTKENQQAFDKAVEDTSKYSQEIATKESSYSSTLSYLKMAKTLDPNALTTVSKTILPFVNWVSKNAGSLDAMIQNIHADGSDINLGLTTVNGKYSQEEFATLASKVKEAADFALSDPNRELLNDTQRAAMIKLGLTFDSLMMNNQQGNGVSQKEFSETYNKLGDDYKSMKNTVEAPLKAVKTRIDSLKQSIKTDPRMKMVAKNSELGEIPNFDSGSASGVSPDTEAFYNSEYNSNDSSQIFKVTNPDDFAKVPSGALYTDPNGIQRRKK
jgi:hypothetical protein